MLSGLRESSAFSSFSAWVPVLDLLLLNRIGGTVSRTDETVVRIIAGVDGAHAIKFANQGR